MKRVLLAALPLYLLDQATKWLVLLNLELHSSRVVIPGFFDLVHYTNTGAAFGMLQDGNVFFIVLSLATLAALAVTFFKGHFADRGSQVALGLLVSGIVGNLTDRFLHGHVIDFLDVYIGEHHWPAFNVADSCICVAAFLFVLSSFRAEAAAKRQAD